MIDAQSERVDALNIRKISMKIIFEPGSTSRP
jgi:hypothetical protein